MRVSHFLILVLLFAAHSLFMADSGFLQIGLSATTYFALSTLLFALWLFGYRQSIVRGKDARFHSYTAAISGFLVSVLYVVFHLLTDQSMPGWLGITVMAVLAICSISLAAQTKKANRSYFIQ